MVIFTGLVIIGLTVDKQIVLARKSVLQYHCITGYPVLPQMRRGGLVLAGMESVLHLLLTCLQIHVLPAGSLLSTVLIHTGLSSFLCSSNVISNPCSWLLSTCSLRVIQRMTHCTPTLCGLSYDQVYSNMRIHSGPQLLRVGCYFLLKILVINNPGWPFILFCSCYD